MTIVVQLNYKYVNPTVDVIYYKSAAESRKTFGNSEVKLLGLIQIVGVDTSEELGVGWINTSMAKLTS